MRDLTPADLRRIANAAGSGRVAMAYAQTMRKALYDAAAQLDRCAEERAQRAVQPLANGGTQ
jgi:histone H3/H4